MTVTTIGTVYGMRDVREFRNEAQDRESSLLNDS